MILFIALRKATNRSQKKPLDAKEEAKIWAKGAASLSFLLGLTWIFGFFIVGHGKQWRFTTVFSKLLKLISTLDMSTSSTSFDWLCLLASAVFAVIFTLLNSFQGVFIFLFYVVMNKRTRRETLKRLDKAFVSVSFPIL